MMRSLLLWTAVVGVLSVGLYGALTSEARADDKKEPKYTIKQVMAKAHKEKLRDKVLAGQASDDEKATLLGLYEALAKNTPPKGDADSWKTKTEAIVKACKAADMDALKAATNCGACHKLHKG